MSTSRLFIAAKKMGMTTINSDSGSRNGVTLLEMVPSKIICKKTSENDGYEAVQVGYEVFSSKKMKKSSLGHQKEAMKNNPEEGYKNLTEVKVSDSSEFELGEDVSNYLHIGEMVTVVGRSKGKGFTGVMKRHNFKGGASSHGARGVSRRPLSAGAMGPARIFPGQKMPGRYGNSVNVQRNSEIIDWDMENGIVAIKGSVPGGRGSLVRIYPQDELPSDVEDPTLKIEEAVEEVKEEAPVEEEAKGEDKNGN
tara:strand:+ start:2107 stop:2862 length:756 start_codon:yes stop_codon:yes gene_type:complete